VILLLDQFVGLANQFFQFKRSLPRVGPGIPHKFVAAIIALALNPNAYPSNAATHQHPNNQKPPSMQSRYKFSCVKAD
jgi:hypothetical protein